MLWVRVKAIKRLPRVFSPSEVQSLLDSCTRLRDRFLLCLLHESGMRIGQALGLRHADIRSYDGAIDIVPRANSNGALAKSRSPYVVHVSKQAMALYADYLVHEYGEVSHDYVFVNWWGANSALRCDMQLPSICSADSRRGRDCGPRGICSVTLTQPISCGCGDQWRVEVCLLEGEARRKVHLTRAFAARPGSENGAAQCDVNVSRNLQIAEKYATNGTHAHAGRLS
jgi:hypothetical protein